VEDYLGVSGDEILYVGDHMYTDVHVSKSIVRWRTALIVRELDADVAAEMAFAERQRKLTRLMRRKAHLELQHARTRLQIQQRRGKYGPHPKDSVKALERRLDHLWKQLQAMDEEIAPLARAATGLSNQRWGLLMRAGNDKSHLARQIERYADVYTSRVSNFLYHTPFMYFRAPRGSLPHDPEIELTP
jgi:hypothetical protein